VGARDGPDQGGMSRAVKAARLLVPWPEH
jgi:hypothetical protein